LKIAVDARRIRPFSTGIGQFTNQLIRATGKIAVEQNVVLDLYLFDQPGLDYPEPVNFKFTDVPLGHPREKYHFKRRLAQDKPDLFLAPAHFSLPTECPQISIVYDLCFWHYPRLYPEALVEKFKSSLDKKISNSDLIFTISESTSNSLYSYIEGNEFNNLPTIKEIDQNTHPAFINENQPAATEKIPSLPEKFILFVGRIQPLKNISLLVEAYHQIYDKISQDLVLVGDTGWDYQELMRKIENGPSPERIHLSGVILENEKLAEIFRQADLYISPSLCEGFNRPLIEAMHCRTAVLASDIPVHREVAGDAGLYFPVDDADRLAEQIFEISKNKKLKRNLVKKGSRKIQKYSWEKGARKLLENARKILHDK